jgi:pimeloyl-ACP methyl ester carboxylesterase
MTAPARTPAPAAATATPTASTAATAPPRRPSPAEERRSLWLFLALAPRLPRVEQPPPPERLAPFAPVWIERPGRRGRLTGTWYPAEGPPRGAVLLLPPWLEWGQSYFHRRRRIERLRAAGYHAMSVDFPGFGGSGPVDGYFDRDVADALGDLARRAPQLPLYLWGVSSGGYWSHPVLSNGAAARTGGRGVAAAFFEDVSPHLIGWASRTAPWARPFHRLFRTLFPDAFRFLDLRLHAPALQVETAAYVSGEADHGVPPGHTRELAAAAGAENRIVPGAGHLEAIKRATGEILDLALSTFEAAG